MYPFTTNSTMNAAAMMSFGAAPGRRMASFGSMIPGNKMSRGAPSNQPLVIRPNDVLCGRGKTSFNHSGNIRFRHIISQAIDEYRAATSKWEKSLVAARLVSVIHSSGGRFLKQKKDNEDEWYELSSSESKSKVSHAIRDAIAATKQTRRTSTGENRPKPAPTTIPSSSCAVPAPSCSSSSCTPMDDSSSATAATAPMDDSSRIPMDDCSSSEKGMLRSEKSFVRPGYRGTWSSNSLVSLTDDSNEKEPARPDSATSKMNECWSSGSEDEGTTAGGSELTDDFASYIHKVLGPAHP